MEIYKHEGRFVVCHYDKRNCQYTGYSPRAARVMGYSYSYSCARSIERLIGLGVPTYATLSGARRAMRRDYGDEGEW